MPSILERNRVQVSGTGSETVVLAHGFGCDQTAWRRVLPFLERHYEVARYDLTGLGRADRKSYDPQRHATLHGHAEDLLELCAALRLKGALFAGHSAGAMIGALASKVEPGVFRKLALIGLSPCFAQCDDGYDGGFQRDQLEGLVAAIARDYVASCRVLVELGAGADADVQVTADLMQQFTQIEPRIAHHFARAVLFSDHRAELGSVALSTLLIAARRDAFVPEQVSRYVATSMPRAELRILGGQGGHFPHLGCPGEVAAELLAFFGRLES